jgi:DNA polymerase-3 subunit alpha
MHLSAHTFFSLRYGTLSPKQLVEAAAQRGIRTLALTDINNTSAALAFVQTCERHSIKPVLGIEFRDQAGKFLFAGLARNREGWGQLCQLLTEYSVSGKALPVTPPPLDDVFIIYTALVKPIEMFRPNEFLGIRPGQVNALFSSGLRGHLDKLVAFSPATFLDAEGFRLHKLLRAIDRNTLITKLTAADMAHPGELLFTEAELLKAYEAYPALIANTRNILDACSIAFETGLQLNRRSFTGSREGDLKLLTKLALSGCARRYGEHHKRARERVAQELKVIADMDFAAYFLITWDIVRYAQSAGYYHVGRGSGANSIVAFCLYITDVDPLELDLYFERFINPHRSSPPDFDIDFSWDERDDVTDYIFKRYGKDHTALLATYNTFQYNAVVREIGKVFGLPKADIDLIAQHWVEVAEVDGNWQWSGRKKEEIAPPPAGASPKPAQKPGAAAQQVVKQLHPWTKHILRFGQMLVDFPNYLSIHAGGVIISEEPLRYATALQMMPKGFPVTHFDMYAAEDWGFHKFDVLSQRGLGHIKDTVDLVRQNQGKSVEIHDVERIKRDEAVRTQLRSGHCIGCFYIESPAMRGLLHKLRCDTYVHLVAASSIIRPGVAQSGMMRAYIYRFHNRNAFEYLHPVFQEHLGETFGVMVYQEDVMKIVHHFAGLDLNESDILRRMMTGKKRSSEAFERLKQKYFHNCRTRGYPDALTNEVWRQIESFSGYSFCKAHSASFAVESFQSLYLKTYFPLEFMVAVINNFGGFYNAEMYVHEARQSGGTIHAPCVNHSGYLTGITGTDIYLGFVHLQGLEQRVATDIVRQRTQHGPFRGLEDFARRVDIKPAQLEILIRIGAFRFTGLSKVELLWDKNRVLMPAGKKSGQGESLFGDDEGFSLPSLQEGRFDQTFDEIELLGFPLCSPFDLLTDAETAKGPGIPAGALDQYLGRQVVMTGYYVCRKDTRTIKGELMQFGTWLDRDGRFFDTVHFPDMLRRTPFRGRGIYRIWGKVVSDFGVLSVEATKMERLAWRADERYG